jgi:hypothetical protein
MTTPIQLQRLPKRKKPATVRALFLWIASVCFFTACAAAISSLT